MNALLSAAISRSAGRKSTHSAISISILTVWLALACMPTAEAGVITVDQQNCNLVDAITAANSDAPAGGCPAGSGDDTLLLTAPVYTLTQVNNGGTGDFYTHDPNGLPVITSAIYLNGQPNGLEDPGVVIERSAASGTPFFRLLDIHANGSLVVQGAILRNGAAVSGNTAPEGGNIRNAGRLKLIGCTVAGGTSSSARPAAGIGGIWNGPSGVTELFSTVVTGNGGSGGIANWGTLSLRESAVTNNTTVSGGSFGPRVGIGNNNRITMLNSTVCGNEEGFGNSGIAEVTNSTISGNSAGGFLNSGVATLNYTTLAWNKATLYLEGKRGALVSTGKLTLSSSVVANNAGRDCAGSVRLSGVNLIGDGSCRAKARGAVTGDPKLGLLTNNGGLTRTHALLSGSPALDAGTDPNPYPETDQRGFPRPQGAKRDLGAFEGTVTAAIGEWQLAAGDRSYAADLDGDGRDEIFVRNGRYAAVLAQRDGGWVSRSVAGGWVGRWSLGGGDRSYPGDFDGDGRAEIFTRRAQAAALIRLQEETLRSAGFARFAVGDWPLNPADQACVGDLDGDGRDEIFIHRDTAAAVLSYRNGRFASSALSISPIGEWPLAAGDVCYSGDFDGDGRDEIFMRSAHQAGLLSYTGSDLTSKTVASGSVGSWQINPSDRSSVGDFDGDGKAEILVQNNVFPLGYLGVLGYDGSQLVSESVMQGPLPRWQLTDADRFYVGDFNGEGKDGVFVRRPRAAGLLAYSIGFWEAETSAFGRIDNWPLRAGDVSTVGDFEADGVAEIYVRNADRAAVIRYRDGRLRSSVLAGGD